MTLRLYRRATTTFVGRGKVKLTVYVNEEVASALRRVRSVTGRPVTRIVEDILSQHVRELEKLEPAKLPKAGSATLGLLARRAKLVHTLDRLHERLTGEVSVRELSSLKRLYSILEKSRIKVDEEDFNEKLNFVAYRLSLLEELYRGLNPKERTKVARGELDVRLRAAGDSEPDRVRSRREIVGRLIEEMKRTYEEYSTARGLFAGRKRRRLEEKLLELVRELETYELTKEEAEEVEKIKKALRWL